MITPKAKNRLYGHAKFGRCGKDDRRPAVEFQHMDIEGFNRACDRFLEECDPSFHKRRAYWAKEKESIDFPEP